MTNEDIYQIWRPENSPWSKWVKPVIFSFLRPDAHGREPYVVPAWKVEFYSDTAIFADLPGAEGVSAGVAMARAGYQPVLVYNACPGESPAGQNVSMPAVDMSAILSAVCDATAEIASIQHPSDAPPVFVLDVNRAGLGSAPEPGWFDNRSFVTSSDFPSAGYLRSHGISRVTLLQPTPDIHPDLLQVLLQWQREGIAMTMQVPWEPWAPSPIAVRPPSWTVSAWERLCQKFGYRRNFPGGSFGALVPPSSS